MHFKGFVVVALGDKIIYPIFFIVKLYKECWIAVIDGEQYDPQTQLTVNELDYIVEVHPAAANDDFTLIYNCTDMKRMLLVMLTDPRVGEILRSLPE